MMAERKIVAPAARDASNQNPSGKSVIRFEPGPNRNVPAGRRPRGRPGRPARRRRRSQRQGERRRTDQARGPQHDRADAPRLAAHPSRGEHRDDRGHDDRDGEEPDEAATSCMCDASRAFSSGGSPAKAASKSPSVKRSPRISPVTRSTSAFGTLKASATPWRCWSSELNAGLKSRSGPARRITTPSATPSAAATNQGARGHRCRSGCQVAFRPAPITIESTTRRC